MFTLLVILVWLAVALVYLLQFQITRDYQPNYYKTFRWRYDCSLKRYSIFDFKYILRNWISIEASASVPDTITKQMEILCL